MKHMIGTKTSALRRAVALCMVLICLCGCALPLLTSCKEISGKVTTLYVYNWGEYISDGSEDSLDSNAAFEEWYYETFGERVRVNYSTFSSNEDMYAKLASGSVSYDVVVPSDYMIQRLIAEGLVQKLDHENIPNLANLHGDFYGENAKFDYYDKGCLYSVPYMYGMVGIIYNTTMVDPDDPNIGSWNLLWDERNADGTRRGSWTRAHWRWISGIRLEGPQRDVLEYYVTAARCAESDRRQLEKKVLALARTDRWRPAVEALSCIKGIDTLTAFRLAAEAGSFTRFRTAPAFASWCGLVPSERSSGETERRGGITKTGNRLARTALVESAWHYLTCTPRPKAPAPGADVPAAIRARADDCTARLCRRREALAAAGKSSCKANAAVARELACWVWEIGRRAEGTLG